MATRSSLPPKEVLQRFFREAIVKNMRFNKMVRNYWLDFTFRSKRLQEDQLEAAHERLIGRGMKR